MADQEDIEVHAGGIIAQDELPAAGGALTQDGRPGYTIVTSRDVPPPGGGEWTLPQQFPPQNGNFLLAQEMGSGAPHLIPAAQPEEVPSTDQAQAAGEDFYSIRGENEALKEEIRRLSIIAICKICLEKPLSALVPCGHLYCCSDCASKLDADLVAEGQERRCPVCRQTFSNVLPVYFA